MDHQPVPVQSISAVGRVKDEQSSIRRSAAIDDLFIPPSNSIFHPMDSSLYDPFINQAERSDQVVTHQSGGAEREV